MHSGFAEIFCVWEMNDNSRCRIWVYRDLMAELVYGTVGCIPPAISQEQMGISRNEAQRAANVVQALLILRVAEPRDVEKCFRVCLMECDVCAGLGGGGLGLAFVR